MSISLLDILTLPKSSNGFTNHKRLHQHLSEPSQPKSKSAGKRRADTPNGPIRIQVVGSLPPPPTPTQIESERGIIKRSISVLLDASTLSTSILSLSPPTSLSSPGSGAASASASVTGTTNLIFSLPRSYDEIYRTTRYLVCTEKYGEWIYDTLSMQLQQCIASLSRQLQSEINSGSGSGEARGGVNTKTVVGSVRLLELFVRICTWFEERVSLLESLLVYLDQVYVPSKHGLSKIRTLAYTLFTSTIYETTSLRDATYTALQTYLTFERDLDTSTRLRLSSTSPSPSTSAATGASAASTPLGGTGTGINPTHRTTIQRFIGYQSTHNYTIFEEFYIDVTRRYYTRRADKLARRAGEPQTHSHSPSQSREDVDMDVDVDVDANIDVEVDAYADGDAPTAHTFFTTILTILSSESERSKALLPPTSWRTVQMTVERACLGAGGKERIGWVANETLGTYIESHNTVHTRKLYTLACRLGEEAKRGVDGAFRGFTFNTVKSIVQDTKRDGEMVSRLVAFKELLTTTINQSFVEEEDEDEPDTKSTKLPSPSKLEKTNTSSTSAAPTTPTKPLQYALSDSFTSAFKSRPRKPAELIASSLDRLLRKGQSHLSEEAYNGELERVLELCRYTDDKDVFRGFYHRGMAKRLVLGRCASTEVERGLLRVLEREYDSEFGMAEDMFKDLQTSKDLMDEYHEKGPQQSSAQKLTVNVLQRSAWPFTVPMQRLDLPIDMQNELDAYTTFYKSKHTGRVLYWDHGLSTVTISASFPKGHKELSLSLYQAVVLLLFNKTDELAFAEIRESTSIEDGVLRRTLQELACGKKRVLRKEPVGRDVCDGDVFRFNAGFEDVRSRIHVNSIQAKVTEEESKSTLHSIEGDRKHLLDAAIVRVMKAKKEMHYEQLKLATIDAVKNHFIPDVESIKKRVHGLVEQEYLTRSESDMNVFVYVA